MLREPIPEHNEIRFLVINVASDHMSNDKANRGQAVRSPSNVHEELRESKDRACGQKHLDRLSIHPETFRDVGLFRATASFCPA